MCATFLLGRKSRGLRALGKQHKERHSGPERTQSSSWRWRSTAARGCNSARPKAGCPWGPHSTRNIMAFCFPPGGFLGSALELPVVLTSKQIPGPHPSPAENSSGPGPGSCICTNSTGGCRALQAWQPCCRCFVILNSVPLSTCTQGTQRSGGEETEAQKSLDSSPPCCLVFSPRSPWGACGYAFPPMRGPGLTIPAGPSATGRKSPACRSSATYWL